MYSAGREAGEREGAGERASYFPQPPDNLIHLQYHRCRHRIISKFLTNRKPRHHLFSNMPLLFAVPRLVSVGKDIHSLKVLVPSMVTQS